MYVHKQDFRRGSNGARHFKIMPSLGKLGVSLALMGMLTVTPQQKADAAGPAAWVAAGVALSAAIAVGVAAASGYTFSDAVGKVTDAIDSVTGDGTSSTDESNNERPADGDGDGSCDTEESKIDRTDDFADVMSTQDVVCNAPPCFRTFGESDMDVDMAQFLDREGSVGVRENLETGSVDTQVQYAVDGYVGNADASVARFVNGDNIVIEPQVTGTPHATVMLPVRFDHLMLTADGSTAEHHHAALWATLEHDGVIVWSWSASVVQGQLPIHDALPGNGEVHETVVGGFRVQDLQFNVPITLDAAGDAAPRLEVYLEGVGARL